MSGKKDTRTGRELLEVMRKDPVAFYESLNYTKADEKDATKWARDLCDRIVKTGRAEHWGRFYYKKYYSPFLKARGKFNMVTAVWNGGCHRCGCTKKLIKQEWIWVVKAAWYNPYWKEGEPITKNVIAKSPTQYYCGPCGTHLLDGWGIEPGKGTAIRINPKTGEVVNIPSK